MKRYYGARTDEVSRQEVEHQQIIRAFSGECMVLLKNDGTLPLAQGGNLALFGKGARYTVKGGTGSGDVYSRETVTIEQGLESAGYKISSKSWLDRYDQILKKKKDEYNTMLFEKATEMGRDIGMAAYVYRFEEPDVPEITSNDILGSETDIAVYVVSRISGEGEDRHDKAGDYRLTINEIQGIQSMAKQYKKSIVLLNVGGSMDLSPICDMENVNAILICGQQGNSTGNCVADVLCGKNYPSGKLTSTWAKAYSDYPASATFSHNNGELDEEMYKEGIYVGYRYFDTLNIKPLYCFGFGLSYTSFEWWTTDIVQEDGEVHLRVQVKNIGNYKGKEVIQVYYSAPEENLSKPYQELIAYAKTKELQPGESETLNISFRIEEMASYSQKMAAWILEKGVYYIRVGDSSRNTEIVAKLEMAEEKVTNAVTNLFEDSVEVAELELGNKEPYSYIKEVNEKEHAKHMIIDPDAICTTKSKYLKVRDSLISDKEFTITLEDVHQGRATIEELTAQLTVEEMVDLCVGPLRGFESGQITSMSIIGNASTVVPGAAGDTTANLWETRGIKNLIMADGPAGLRLIPHYKINPDGMRVPGGDVAGDVISPFDEDYITEGTVDYYQYCTALPIGLCLAQSWNLEMLKRVGNLVGKEMKDYHVDLWLAPALNIHRDPLCGRNFEYYSEDPVISGKCASAITQGVQKNQEVGTTLKHFAANNQETNRVGVNSHISERALRELYLKNFEIAVKEAQPMAIMTSYNLINGVHSANNYDLLQHVARDEWGFEGIIMTDWFATVDMSALAGEKPKYPVSSPVGAVKAGNDLIMPGSKGDIDAILAGVKTGELQDDFRITVADLQFCARNILNTVMRCSEQLDQNYRRKK